jgi:hypothetical protein
VVFQIFGSALCRNDGKTKFQQFLH